MPAPLMSPGYVYYGARLLAQMAEVLDKPAEKQKYEAVENQVAAPSIASSGMKLRADMGRIAQSATRLRCGSASCRENGLPASRKIS
jgi:hypothetical protein